MRFRYGSGLRCRVDRRAGRVARQFRTGADSITLCPYPATPVAAGTVMESATKSRVASGLTLILLGLGLYGMQYFDDLGESVTLTLLGGLCIAAYLYSRADPAGSDRPGASDQAAGRASLTPDRPELNFCHQGRRVDRKVTTSLRGNPTG